MEGHVARVERTTQRTKLNIPAPEVCLALLKEYGAYPNIIAHCKQVAQVALFLSEALSHQGLSLNIPLLTAGALLHDIAKAYSIEHPEVNHAEKGAEWLIELGYPEVAEIVRFHVNLSGELKIDEKSIVNYADKRVKHDTIVSLEERFKDLLARYGKTEARGKRIRRLYERTKRLETLIFAPLPFSPDIINTLGERYEKAAYSHSLRW
ncbi:MAG: HDIG domain-containing protein [Candidatus Desulfofervidaceae bacterium]|nr:HDIG domain-containing protein [Candidatus Desulfofervidaceae bacterium]